VGDLAIDLGQRLLRRLLQPLDALFHPRRRTFLELCVGPNVSEDWASG
jgi:hypothetical protein